MSEASPEPSKSSRNWLAYAGLIIALAIGLGAIGYWWWHAGGVKDLSFIRTQHKDLAYGIDSQTQKLDLYIPNEGAKPFPLVIAIHGGGFALGDKGDGQLNGPIEAIRSGYAVASINYRLSGEATFPDAIRDVKGAIRWLRANAAQYDLNPARFAVWGGSAGGNLAALAATARLDAGFDDPMLGNVDQSSAVQAAVIWFAPIDFLAMDAQFKASGAGAANHNASDSFESKYLGKPVQEVADLAKQSNPTTYLSADTPPLFIQHGDKDDNVPVEQSKNFAEAAREVMPEGTVTLEIIPGAGHGGAAFETPENIAKVIAFLDRHLKAK